MGVQFLSSYIREFLIRKKHITKHSYSLSPKEQQEAYIIIDAHNFVMRAYNGEICDVFGLPRLPYVNGNNALAFCEYLKYVFHLFKKNGIHAVLVYDGHTSDNENREDKGDFYRQRHLDLGEQFRVNHNKLADFNYDLTLRVNLKEGLTEDLLRNYFSKFATVTKYIELVDYKGRFACVELAEEKSVSFLLRKAGHIISNIKCIISAYDMNNHSHRPMSAWTIIEEYIIPELEGFVESVCAVEEADRLLVKVAREKSKICDNVFVLTHDSDLYLQKDLAVIENSFTVQKGAISLNFLKTNELIEAMLNNLDLDNYEQLITVFSLLSNDYTDKQLVDRFIVDTLGFTDANNLNPASLFRYTAVLVKQKFLEHGDYETVIRNIHGENAPPSIAFVNGYYFDIARVETTTLVSTLIHVLEGTPWSSRRILVSGTPDVSQDQLWFNLTKKLLTTLAYSPHSNWRVSDSKIQVRLKQIFTDSDRNPTIHSEIVTLDSSDYEHRSDNLSQLLSLWKHSNMNREITEAELLMIKNDLLKPFLLIFCYMIHELEACGILHKYKSLFDVYLLSLFRSAVQLKKKKLINEYLNKKLPRERYLGDEYYQLGVYLQVGCELFSNSKVIAEYPNLFPPGFVILTNGLDQSFVFHRTQSAKENLEVLAAEIVENDEQLLSDWKTLRELIIQNSSNAVQAILQQ